MERHFLHIHQSHDKRPYVCETCGMRFVTKAARQAHIDVRHEHRYKFTCCEKNFASRQQYKIHISTAHMGQRFICFPCNKAFRSANYLQKHRVRKHDPDYVTEVYQCEKCDKEFYSRFRYNIHVNEHINGPSVYICDICGKKVTSSNSLRNHKLLHNGEKRGSCSVCGKRFNNKKNLKRHEVIHTNERKYECTHCDKKFTQRSTLVIHLRYHTGERPYACSHCDKTFVSRSLLNTHAKVHRIVEVKVEKLN